MVCSLDQPMRTPFVGLEGFILRFKRLKNWGGKEVEGVAVEPVGSYE